MGGANSWSNPRVLLTIALIFLCGALVGALAVTVTVETNTAAQPAGEVGISTSLTLSSLTTELNLDADQQQRLQKVLDDYFQYYHALQDQLDEVKASGQQRILEILNEQQQARFRAMMEEARAKGQ